MGQNFEPLAAFNVIQAGMCHDSRKCRAWYWQQNTAPPLQPTSLQWTPSHFAKRNMLFEIERFSDSIEAMLRDGAAHSDVMFPELEAFFVGQGCLSKKTLSQTNPDMNGNGVLHEISPDTHLSADLCGFSALSAKMTADILLDTLNSIIREVDQATFSCQVCFVMGLPVVNSLVEASAMHWHTEQIRNLLKKPIKYSGHFGLLQNR